MAKDYENCFINWILVVDHMFFPKFLDSINS